MDTKSTEKAIVANAIEVGDLRGEMTDDEEDSPEIIFTLEEDPNRKDQLFSFRKEQPTPTQNYHAKEQQLLQEGKLGNSEFSARLRKVIFGIFDDQPACLIAFRIDFETTKKGWFRFRNATIELEFEDIGDNDCDGEDEDDEDDNEYVGLLVRKIYPELIRGHIQSAAQTYELGFEVPVAPVGGAGISATFDVTSPREGLHLIQGRLMGSPETRVKWVMNENEVNKGGIYEQPIFAIVVRYTQDLPFTMALKIKATTYGGLPVTGKGGSRIRFNPIKAIQPSPTKQMKSTSRLTGGSFEVGNREWISSGGRPEAPIDLDTVDLEDLTRMKIVLLSKQGPGAGPSIFPTVDDP
ncbi:MAG: hypothetical protein Q9213_003154 [Squamulea squamosa]